MIVDFDLLKSSKSSFEKRRRYRAIHRTIRRRVLTSYFIGHERNLDPDIHIFIRVMVIVPRGSC